AHEGELDLVLDVFYMEGAAAGLAAHERAHHRLGERGNDFADARRGRTLAAVDGEERLRHGDGDLGRLEGDHGAVAADHLVVGIGASPRIARLRNGDAQARGDRGVLLSYLHVPLSRVLFVPGDVRRWLLRLRDAPSTTCQARGAPPRLALAFLLQFLLQHLVRYP